MVDSRPELTVLMPAYNAAGYLRATLESILRQTFPRFELLIVDDGSTDDTASIAESFRDPRIRLVRNEQNLGIVATLNRGLELAAGDLIARHDADDLSHPARFEKQIDYLRRNPRVALLGTQAMKIDSGGRHVGWMLLPCSMAGIRWFRCFDNPFVHSAVIFRSEIVRALSGYKSFKACEDFDLWSRICDVHEVANLPEVLLRYRMHGASIMASVTQPPPAVEAANREIIRRNLESLTGTPPTESDVDAASHYRQSFSGGRKDSAAFDRLLARLHDAYAWRAPEAVRSPDFRRTLAVQLMEVAYKLITVNRPAALAYAARSAATWPPIVAKFPWVRGGGLFLLGPRARDIYTAVFQRR